MSYISNRNPKGNQKNIKDYILPIISVLFILALFISVLSGGKKTTTNEVVNNDLIKISLVWESPEAYVTFPGWSKEKIDDSIKNINIWEKIQVTNWNVKLDLGAKWKMLLNKLWELKLNDDNSFTLSSSDLWVEANSAQKISLSYLNAELSASSVANFTQNEVSNTVYVLKWSVKITNLSGNSTTLNAGSSLSLMMNESNNPSLDLASKIGTIDDYTKTDDWFKQNSGMDYLNAIDLSASMSGSTASWSTASGTTMTSDSWATTDSQASASSNTSAYINIAFPKDEYVSDASTINIKWTVIDPNVTKIAFDYDKATITNWNFEVKNFTLKSKTNDIVYRIYDTNNNLVQKWVVTVYYTNSPKADETATDNKLGLENYTLKPSEFSFISPTENPYSTTDDVVMIEWRVPAKRVAKVVVNWFALGKFVPNGTYWKYFANAATDNLKEWLNLYKVEYYWADGKFLYSNVFTIIKKAKDLTTDWNQKDTTTWTWTAQ